MQFPNQKPAGLWRATPPAIFPPILGLTGLGLAWRQASLSLGAPDWLGEALLGAVTLLFAFALFAYAAKIARRPSALTDDLKILPGRAGLSAGSTAYMLMAAVFTPYNQGLAEVILLSGLAAHTVLAALIIRALALGPAEQRRVSPAWHLSFVGFIIGALSAPALGYPMLALVILSVTFLFSAAIWAASAVQFKAASVPAPLRPLLAIHLAPLCLFSMVSGALGLTGLQLGFAGGAAVLLAVLLIGARWLTAAPFSALWGAFTFPMAAFCSTALRLPMDWAQMAGGAALVLASLAITAIAIKVMQAWAKGKLATATNAARA